MLHTMHATLRKNGIWAKLAVMFDHFGWLGLAQRPIDLPRLAGIAFLIGGCVLIRR